MDLIRMRSTIEDFLSCMDRVGDHDDFRHVVGNASLIDATSNREKFHLHACDKGSVMDCFD